MINLIPPFARKKIKLEYWTRVLTVWMILIACGLFITAALTFPTRVLLLSLSNTLSPEIDKVKNQLELFEELESEVTEANALIKHLDTSTKPNLFSEIIYSLDSIAEPNIRLTQFTFSETDSGLIESVSIVGYAANRSDLSSFRDELESSEGFMNVELPISNLTKDKDITFTLQVGVNNSK